MQLTALRIPFAGGYLSVLAAEDVHPAYVAGLNDPEVNRFLVAVKENRQTAESVSEYVRENLEAADAVLLGIWRDGCRRHCGTVRLHEIDPRAARAVIGVCIFAKTAWRTGTGSSAIRAATQWALDSFGLEEIEAGVYAENVASQRAFSKAGYVWAKDISDRYTFEGRPALVKLYLARARRRDSLAQRQQ